MNTLSKILIIACISMSLQNISAYQDPTDAVNTDGIIQIGVVLSDTYGTGFFISPHTFITTWHVIDRRIRNGQQIDLSHPVTGARIPVHSIQAVDLENNLAVLHISEYESPVYYELFEGSEESLSSSEVYIFGHRGDSFPKLEGELSSYYDGQNIEVLSLPFSKALRGLKGSPVFSKEGKVIGMLTDDQDHRLQPQVTEARFQHIDIVQKLLQKPPLNCRPEHCLREKLVPQFANGIVTVIDRGNGQGSGFFVDPHTLITAWHVVDGFKGNVSDKIFIVHPKTGRWIPVHSIQALNFRRDLVIFSIKEYKSPVYYELFEGSEESLASSEAYLFDRREASSPKLEGTLSPHYASETLKWLSLFYNQYLNGLSGSPIFSIDDKVIGVLTKQEITSNTQAKFANTEDVKKLLLKPSLDCQFAHCIQDEIILQQHTIFAELHALLSESEKNDFREKLTGAQRKIENKNFVSLKFLWEAWLKRVISNYDYHYYAKDFAEKGHPGAFYLLSRIYEEGYGVHKDLEKARTLEQKALDLGYIPF